MPAQESAPTDEAYRKVGASIAGSAAEIFAASDMIVKVKEPQPREWSLLRDGQILFTYLHLAPDPGAGQGPDGFRLHRDRL